MAIIILLLALISAQLVIATVVELEFELVIDFLFVFIKW
jgi:uncharacterized protein YccT (UPF0319 family)